MIVYGRGNQSRAAYPLIFSEGQTPPDERKEGDANEYYIFGLVPGVTFHCCLVSLCHQIFKGKNKPPLLRIVDG